MLLSNLFISTSILVVVVFSLITCAQGYNILVIATSISRSHFILGKAMADTLHDRGHKVTFIHNQPAKKLPYREIAFPHIGKSFEDAIQLDRPPRNSFSQFMNMYMSHDKFMPFVINSLLSHEEMMKFMANRNEKFDLVIIDYLMNDVFAAFGVKYNCPVIIVSTVSMMHSLARHTGNPLSTATVANIYTDCTPEMTFIDRLKNTLMTILAEVMEYTVCDKHQELAYRKYFPEEAQRMSYSEVKRRIAMVFSNTHPSIGTVRPILPNVVEIGGFHIGKVPHLSEEYQKIMNNSKNGVIFFSMGSVLNGSSMPEAMKNGILKSFSKLAQTIIWKFEADLPDKPKNVIVSKWVPQASILAHPNTKLFITHGGLLSATEATTSGVPLISIPIFGDQYYNAMISQSKKTGLFLDLHNVSEKSFAWAINEILNNPIYHENAQKQQNLFMDRPMHPRDLVSFYAEHVIRTAGAKHLSAPHLNLFSYMLLDVIAVLLIPPLGILGVVFFTCRRICCAKRNKISTKKKRD